MGITAGVVVGLGSAYMSSEAAKGAAETQAQAGREAMSTQERYLAEQRKLMEPFRTAGLGALDRLIKGTTAGGEFTKSFTMAESPAQQFATKQALAAMQSQMATGGQALSSNAITGAGRLAGDIGAQYEAQAYNQWLQGRQAELAPLEYLANMGQSAATGTAGDVGGAGRNIAGLQTGIGNVQAAGQVGSAAALSQGMGNISQFLMMQSLLGNRQPTTTTPQNQPLPPGGMTATGSIPQADYYGYPWTTGGYSTSWNVPTSRPQG